MKDPAAGVTDVADVVEFVAGRRMPGGRNGVAVGAVDAEGVDAVSRPAAVAECEAAVVLGVLGVVEVSGAVVGALLTVVIVVNAGSVTDELLLLV